MGKETGFLELDRKDRTYADPKARLKHYNEFVVPLPESELRAQASRCMNCGIPYCHNGCPVNNIIPDWNHLVYEDDFRNALEVLHSTNNFPEFTGRICPAPCEAACTLNIIDQPVTIKSIECAIVDKGWDNGWIAPQVPAKRTGKTVAVVGSGPAGLAAAQQLARAGHSVTVFEKNDRIGGLLRYGIPDFKMEKHLINRRGAQMEAEGVQFRTSTEVGVTVSVASLKENFDAIVLAGGAEDARKLDIPGAELPGVRLAMEFLTQQNKRNAGDDEMRAAPRGSLTATGKNVVVIGGGDTGSDCVGTSIRQGAKSVTCAYRRDAKNMPGSRREVKNAKDEGVKFLFNRQPVAIVGEDRVEGVKVVETRLGEPDARGRRSPEPIPGSEQILPADAVVIAFGFRPSPAAWFQDFEIGTDEQGRVVAPEQGRFKFQTGNPKVFAGGDMVRGSDLVVTAIHEGRQAAEGILDYLGV